MNFTPNELAAVHDAQPGRLAHCQVSGSTELEPIIDLGHQPPCAALLDDAALHAPERTYPLRLMLCPESGLAQLDYVVPGTEIYPKSYPYRSGISKPVEAAQKAFAASLVRRLGLEAGELVVDVGSNDGTLLAAFKAHGVRVLGVEPTAVAKIAIDENGVETLQAFFTERLAREIAEDLGQARLITATHVFAHMADLGEVMRALDRLLGPDGVFVLENHYLLDVLHKHQFDSIYHEHLRTYSLKALVALFPQYGMQVFDVERAERYGGNIRAFIARQGRRPVSGAVGALLEVERREGLAEPGTWRLWRERVLANRDGFMEWLHKMRRQGQRIAGKSCPGRAATLINFYGLRPDQVPYLGELPGSLKLGKYLPGAHIPIVEETRLLAEQPDYVILFDWHYADVIAQRLRAAGLESRFVMPLPHFEVLR
jgi:SAM-dependent methyltransferase